MSVPVNSRSKSKLEVCVKARELCVYTIKITSNKNVFTEEFQKPLADGMDYLGFTFRLTESGRVLMLIKSDNIRAQRRKLPRLVRQSKNGKMPKEKVDESYQAWQTHVAKGNTYGCVRRMDRLYKNLWR